MAQSVFTRVLLLFLVWGVCPHDLGAGQRERDRRPVPAPLLPAEQAWLVTLPSAPSAPGALDESRAYIPLQSGRLIALDRESGEASWTRELDTSWAPVVGDGVVYVAASGTLQALQPSSGERLWAVPLDGAMAPLAVQGGVILALVKPGDLRAFRVSDGHEIWKRSLGILSGSVAIASDATSVCVSFGGRLVRLALTDGTPQWERDVPGVLSAPSLARDRVFVGSTDNSFYAFHLDTGRLAWRWRSGGDVVGSVADDGLVYVASLDQVLRAFRRGNGTQAWKRELATRTTAPPSTFGGLVLVSGNTPTLSTFDASTGAPLATYSAPADLQGATLVDPVLQPFRVAMVAVTRDGRAVGLRPVGMMFREPPLVPLRTLPGRPLTREPFATPNVQRPTPKD